MVDFNKLKPGSIVVVRGGFGAEPPVKVTVTDVLDDIKNGRPGIDYINKDGGRRWAYATQIDRVESY